MPTCKQSEWLTIISSIAFAIGRSCTRLPMQSEFNAIVQSRYGAPENVLRIASRRFATEDLGSDSVVVKVKARPIHPGDIQILSALPQGGPVVPIPEGTLRVPGFEGVGTIAWL